MALVTMKTLLEQAEKNHRGIGAFSVGNMEMVKGAVQAAEELNTPIILQIAEVRLNYSPLALMGPMMVQAAREAVQVGLLEVKPWKPIGDMGHAVHMYARSRGYSVVEEIGGHGVGLQFHEEPWVSYVAQKGSGEIMVPGMVFTIEPMINMGGPEVYVDDKNGGTVYTEDGMPSAQWEVTVAVTQNGYEVLAR